MGCGGDPDGSSTFRQILFFSILLIPVSVLPAVLGICGWFYVAGALGLGLFMLRPCLAFGCNRTAPAARRVLKATVLYLPLLLLLIMVDFALG